MFWKHGLFPKKRIYADAAAATPLSARAKKELLRASECYGNAGALHKEGVAAKWELERARERVAKAIGAHADEIIFTASGTEANNLACKGVSFEHGLTSVIEHQSVLEPLNDRNVTILPVNSEGLVDLKKIAEAITTETGFVSIQLVNSEIGTIEPVREISRTLRRAQGGSRPLFHTDASQAPLWLNIKVEKLGVDLMTLDSQKIMGPKGAGCLYIKRGTLLEPLIRGGGQEKGLRAGTEAVPLVCAFAEALEEAQERVEERCEKILQVRDFLTAEIIKLIPNAVINGPAPLHRVANNINISVSGLMGDMAVIALDAEGVAASTRSTCEVEDAEPSRVIEALGLPRERAQEAVRFTLLPDANLDDAKRIAKVFSEIAKRYRNVL